MIKRLILTIGLLTSFLAQGQIAFGPRFEIQQGSVNAAYIVIPNGEEGLLLVSSDWNGLAEDNFLSIEYLDKNLQRVWSNQVKKPQRYTLKGHLYKNKKTYLLLESTALNEVMVLRIDALNSTLEAFESREVDRFRITEFEVVGHSAVLGGYVDERPAVFVFDLQENKMRTPQNVFQNQSLLAEIKVNDDDQTFNVLTTVNDDHRERTIQINTYDHLGNPVRDYHIEKKPDYELITGAISSINELEQVVVGLYGYKGDHPLSGIYVNHINRKGEQTMTYHNFAELPQFFDHLGEKASKKQLEKLQSMRAKGKEPRYRLESMPRKLIEQGDQLIFAGEFFRSFSEAEVRDANRYFQLPNPRVTDIYTNYGVLKPWSKKVPGPESFSHAYTLVLNRDGSIAWADNLKLGLFRLSTLKELGDFQWTGDRMAYTYYNFMELFSGTMEDSGLGATEYSRLRPLRPEETINFENPMSLGTVGWYDNHFLVYGIQQVKSSDKSLPPRMVFFVNKLSVKEMEVASRLDE